MPKLADMLIKKFPRSMKLERIALSDRTGTIELRMPIVDGVAVEGCCTVSAKAAATYPGCVSIEVPMDRLDNVYDGNAGFMKIDVEGHEQEVLDGAIETVRRCRPRVLVEVLELLAPGGIERARTYFDSLGYVGYFVHDGFLKPVEQFSVQHMQDPANYPDLTAPLTARQRFGPYIYNFIFVPREEAALVAERLAERLADLRTDA